MRCLAQATPSRRAAFGTKYLPEVKTSPWKTPPSAALAHKFWPCDVRLQRDSCELKHRDSRAAFFCRSRAFQTAPRRGRPARRFLPAPQVQSAEKHLPSAHHPCHPDARRGARRLTTLKASVLRSHRVDSRSRSRSSRSRSSRSRSSRSRSSGEGRPLRHRRWWIHARTPLLPTRRHSSCTLVLTRGHRCPWIHPGSCRRHYRSSRSRRSMQRRGRF